MSHARTPDAFAAPADERIPFPHTDRPTPCQNEPTLFAFEEVTDRHHRRKTLAKAKLTCSHCPVVQDCLKWALANPALTRTGVWAATTPGTRGVLRKRLVQRLGDNWVQVVADQDRRRERRNTAATVAPATRERLLARLELELIPTRPQPHQPWREPLTPRRRAHNLRLLEHALAVEARRNGRGRPPTPRGAP